MVAESVAEKIKICIIHFVQRGCEITPSDSRMPRPLRKAVRLKDMWQLYILQSLKDHRTYVGHTQGLARRLKEHNEGRVRATSHRRLFKAFDGEHHGLLAEAEKREVYWKNGAGRRKLKEFFKNPEHAISYK